MVKYIHIHSVTSEDIEYSVTIYHVHHIYIALPQTCSLFEYHSSILFWLPCLLPFAHVMHIEAVKKRSIRCTKYSVAVVPSSPVPTL